MEPLLQLREVDTTSIKWWNLITNNRTTQSWGNVYKNPECKAWQETGLNLSKTSMSWETERWEDCSSRGSRRRQPEQHCVHGYTLDLRTLAGGGDDWGHVTVDLQNAEVLGRHDTLWVCQKLPLFRRQQAELWRSIRRNASPESTSRERNRRKEGPQTSQITTSWWKGQNVHWPNL